MLASLKNRLKHPEKVVGRPWLKFRRPTSESLFQERVAAAGLHTDIASHKDIVEFREKAGHSIIASSDPLRVSYAVAAEFGIEEPISLLTLQLHLHRSKGMDERLLPFWGLALLAAFLSHRPELDLPEDTRIFGLVPRLKEDATTIPFIELQHGRTWLHVKSGWFDGAEVRPTDLIAFRRP
jgi:hypothetical protein